MRLGTALLVLACSAAAAHAGTVIGKLDLPPPPARPAPPAPGFLERVENPLLPVKPVAVTPRLVVALVGDEKPVAPPQVIWRLLGESFDRPVIAVPAGSEVVIRDDSKTARTLVASEAGVDSKLIPPGPINPSGTKPFRVTKEGAVYTIGDPDAPSLTGTLIVVNTLYIAYPDETGRFQIADVPPGAYKLRIWYGGKLLDRPDDDVNVAVKGKTEVSPKIPAGYPVKK